MNDAHVRHTSAGRRPVEAAVLSSLAFVLGGCMAAYELRPLFEDLEVPMGSDFVYDSPETRVEHPSRYYYEVEEGAFGRLPRIYLEARARLQMDQNRDLDEATFDTDSLALIRTRITIDSGRHREWVNYRVELQDSRSLISETPGAETDVLDVRQALVSISRPRAVWSGKVGRMELDVGSGRLVGVDWHSNLDRSFDGGRFTLSDRWGRFEPRQWSWRLESFIGSPVTVAPESVNQAHDDPDIFGLYYSDRRVFPLAAEAGLMVTRTRDATHAGELGGTGRERFATVSGRLSGERMGRADGFGFELESALQFGRAGPDPHAAAANAAAVSYTFPTPWAVRVRACVEHATADADPLDGRSGGFRALFPGDMRDRTGLLRFIGMRNAVVGSVGASFGPLEDFRLGADARWLRLATGADLWYAADGTAQAVVGCDIGFEIDLSGRYSFVTEAGQEVWIEGGYAVLEPGPALVGASGKVQTLYLQASFRF